MSDENTEQPIPQASETNAPAPTEQKAQEHKAKPVAKQHISAKKAHAKAAAEESDDDDPLDSEVSFSMPVLFKKKKDKSESRREAKSHKKDSEDDAEVSFDFKKLISFLKNPWIITALLLIVPLFFAVHLRVIGQDLPITDQWATQTVTGYYQNQIIQQINQQYPNLPDANKQSLAAEQFAKFKETNKAQIDAQIAQQSTYFKSTLRYADAKGNPDVYTYMPDIDPYFYLRQARNIEEKGMQGDEMRNGTQWDTHMIAPYGTQRPFDMHPYVMFYLYKVMSFFDAKITLMQATTFLPALLIALSVLPAFFLGRRLGGNVGGFFAALALGTTIAILSRTTWGHPDTDSYNVLFPVLAMWLFYEVFEAKKRISQIILALCLSATLALFSVFWTGWWFLFDFMMIAMGAHIVYHAYLGMKRHKKASGMFKNAEIKTTFIVMLVTAISSLVLVSWSSSFSIFMNVLNGPFGFVNIKAASLNDLWPNVLTTVAELNPASLSDIMNQLGGRLFFWLSVVGFAVIAFKKDKEGNFDLKHSILLIFWFLATIYASFKGVRFILLIAPAFAIGVGAFMGIFYKYAVIWSEKYLSIKKWFVAPVVIVLCAVVFIAPIQQGYAVAQNDVPMVNDAWWEALTAVKDNSSSNAIINSWWDFGHHFKYIADRAVTFDGASQANYPAHWIGKTLLTDNETLATGILRMLDCGQGTSYEILNKEINDTSVAVSIIYKILAEDKVTARKILLSEGVSAYTADAVLYYTHCQPPEDFFITSQDMISKSGVWGHFGSWNFNKADWWINIKPLPRDKAIAELMDPKNRYNLTQQQAEDIYYQMQTIPDETAANSWIAPWPGYMSSQASCGVANGLLVCQNGVAVNLTTQDVILNTQGGQKHPKVLVYLQNDQIVTKWFNNSDTIDVGVSLVGDYQNGYSTILASPEITAGMFNKLFFFDGKGMKHFEKFIERRDISGFKIVIWKVNWDGIKDEPVVFEAKTNESISNATKLPPYAPENTTEVFLATNDTISNVSDNNTTTE